jgi:hypothetical protein
MSESETYSSCKPGMPQIQPYIGLRVYGDGSILTNYGVRLTELQLNALSKLAAAQRDATAAAEIFAGYMKRIPPV